LYLAHTVYGADAAAAANYSTFFIAPIAMTVESFREVHATAGTDGAAVTLQLEKLSSTTAPGSGSNVLTTALSLKATANTVQTGSLTTTLANRALAIGNRLALKKSGTLTAVANVTVLVELSF
jgi:3-deoxy-D-arabino-heptulosonate 7-phosphate (DAHP) synthase class II